MDDERGYFQALQIGGSVGRSENRKHLPGAAVRINSTGKGSPQELRQLLV
jgi:hypothetical protein